MRGRAGCALSAGWGLTHRHRSGHSRGAEVPQGAPSWHGTLYWPLY